MSNRIKVGNVFLELPESASDRPTQVVAEKADTPEMIEPVAFTPSEPDLVAQYMARPAEQAPFEGKQRVQEAELDQMTEWQAFAGMKSAHPQQWLAYTEGKQKHCGFNAWALLFGAHWFLFYKMYGIALVTVVVELFLVLAAFAGLTEVDQTNDLSAYAFPLKFIIFVAGFSVPRLIVAYLANIALLRKAEREIAKIRTFSIDNKRKLAMIASAGSGSLPSIIMLYVALAVLKIIASN